MSIPTVPGSEMDVSTPGQGAKGDMSAATAPARATMAAIDSRYRGVKAVASGIEEVGDQFGRLASDMDKVHRATIAADADFKMRAAQQSLTESLRGDENEKNWPERAQQTYEQVHDDIFSSHNVPPGMRAQLDASVREWGQTLQIKTQTLAQVQSINRAELSIKKSYDEAGRDQDAQGMLNAVKLGRSSKLDPVAMDEMEQNIPRALALTSIETGMQTNPKGTHDLLASGGSLPIADQNGNAIVPKKVFPPKELTALIDHASSEAKKWQTGNLEKMLEQDRDPMTGMVPEANIRKAMKAGLIDSIAGENKIKAQDREIAAKTNKEKATLLSADRQQASLLNSRMTDPTLWGSNPSDFAHELISDAASINDAAVRAKVISDVHKHEASIKKTGQTAEAPIERQIMSLIREDRDTQGAMAPLAVTDIAADPGSKGFMGFLKKNATPEQTQYKMVPGGIAAIRKMNDDTFALTFGDKTTKDEVIQNINVHAARVENEMREWFKTDEGQKATFEKANAHRQEIERPYVMDSVCRVLSKKAPMMINTPNEAKALAPGTPFMTPDGQLRYAR